MILIVLVIIVFGGLAVFLFSFAGTLEQPEYTDLYVTNLLLSLMRTNTGYQDSQCSVLSDAISCAFFESDWRCGTSGPTCLELVNETITNEIGRFSLIQQNYRYLFIAKPEKMDTVTGEYVEVMNPVTSEPLRVKVGDLSLEQYRGKKIVRSYAVHKSTRRGPMIIRTQLILSQRED